MSLKANLNNKFAFSSKSFWFSFPISLLQCQVGGCVNERLEESCVKIKTKTNALKTNYARA